MNRARLAAVAITVLAMAAMSQTAAPQLAAQTAPGGVAHELTPSDLNRIPLPPPDGLKPLQAADGSVTLEWKPVNRAAEYEVFRLDGSNGKAIAIGRTKDSSFPLGMAADSDTFAVSSIDARGNASEVSDGVKARAQKRSAEADASESCIEDVWASFNRKSYEETLATAGHCIEQFGQRASREQTSLAALKGRAPAMGLDKMPDAETLSLQWAINDVSASWCLRGQAAEQLFDRTKESRYLQLAKDSYAAAAKLSFGIRKEPAGWFWSPAKVASDRLAGLTVKTAQ